MSTNKNKEFKYPVLNADSYESQVGQKYIQELEKRWDEIDARRLTGERLGKEIAEVNNLERPGSFQGWLYKHRNHRYRIPAFDLPLWKLAFKEFTKIRVISGFGLYMAYTFYQFTHSTPVNINYESFSTYPFGEEPDMDGGIVHYGYLVDLDKWRFDDFQQV